MRRPEVLFFIAALVGYIIGKLIRNFKWGFLIGITVAAIYAFVTRPKPKDN
jgi:tetrahydromethanopterin S-methyltransferase subunit B